MTCRFCGRQTRGPWMYCDADCEQDHEAELATQESPDDDMEPLDTDVDENDLYADAFTGLDRDI